MRPLNMYCPTGNHFYVLQTHQMGMGRGFQIRGRIPGTATFVSIPKYIDVPIDRGRFACRFVPWTLDVQQVLQTLKLSIAGRFLADDRVSQTKWLLVVEYQFKGNIPWRRYLSCPLAATCTHMFHVHRNLQLSANAKHSMSTGNGVFLHQVFVIVNNIVIHGI